jgi:hypothetical protein
MRFSCHSSGPKSVWCVVRQIVPTWGQVHRPYETACPSSFFADQGGPPIGLHRAREGLRPGDAARAIQDHQRALEGQGGTVKINVLAPRKQRAVRQPNLVMANTRKQSPFVDQQSAQLN